MKRKLYMKMLSLLLAVSMLVGMAFPVTVSAEGESDEASISDYDSFLTELEVLEEYAEYYIEDNKVDEDPIELVLNFIRTGVEKYNDGQWETFAGEEKTEFVEYVEYQDELFETNVMGLRDLASFEIPDGSVLEVEHLFGSMNMTYYARIHKASVAEQTADLSGWAGDLVDLLLKAKDVTGDDVNAITDIIYNEYLGKDLGENSFDQEDINADLDSFYIMDIKKYSDESLSDIMKAYYTDKLTNESRAEYFLKNRFEGAESRLQIRDAVWETYSENTLVGLLEGTRELDGYTDQRMACAYAFGDYLFYLAGNGDDNLVRPEEPEDPEQPEDDDKDDDALTENSYYEVFSSKTTNLAPGVTQTVKYAMSRDEKQLAYFIAKADITRDDVDVYANYNNNDGSVWGLCSVRNQLLAAQEKHSNPNSDKYIENYNAVVGVNGDFFNMSTGQPSGALVMEGVTYQEGGNENFFAILKDGSVVLGTADEWDTYKDQVKEAIGGSITLVKDGEIAVSASSDYYSNRAGRTCVGVTADGEVVLMVLDGRQEPYSCGGSAQEIAQIMYDAGCVNAMNLDGGGSSTFIAKQEGADDVSLLNSPSDGYERKVSSSLIVVSTAKISNEFDHAAIDAENTYAAVGADIALTATGVSESGNSAALPEDAVWAVEDETIGTITADGVFTAKAVGDAVINLKSGDAVIGTMTIHVVTPNRLEFREKEVAVIYGDSVVMPIRATYNGNEVTVNLDSGLIEFAVEDTTTGSFTGGTFTAASEEECSIRLTPVTAKLASNEKISASSIIYFYKAGEATFDFNNPTAGDRKLAWNRTVSNSVTTDNYLYEIVDPDEDMQIGYTFAVDMNYLEIPENIEEALPVLAAFMGESDTEIDEDATAWELMLSLAERISPSTTVTVSLQLADGVEADLSELMINCEYFELTDMDYDKETGKITLVCNWIKVYGPIDPATSNSVCIVSGIKLNVKDGANLDENDQLIVVNKGSIDYMARLRSTQAYSIAGSSLGASYGLSQYDNSANLENDKGAEFSSTHATFEDNYVLDLTCKEGWVTTEEGSQFYYVRNKMLTGIQCVPTPDGSGKLYYVFGEDGVCKGKYTGFVEKDGGLAYAVAGSLRQGWTQVDGKVYYFNYETYLAVDGEVKINDLTYTFENKVLVKGAFVTNSNGTRYYWAGYAHKPGWIVVDGEDYCIDEKGFIMKGIRWGHTKDDTTILRHVFDSNTGVFQGNHTGRYDYEGNTYWVEKGIVIDYPGLVLDGNNYYYFNDSAVAVKNGTYYVKKTNGLLPEGNYIFEEDGKLFIYTGFLEGEDGEFYYYEDGRKTYAGLIVIDGYYYYVDSSYKMVHNTTYTISKTNNLLDAGEYEFDEDGKLILKDGFVEEDGELYYYEKGKKVYAGLIDKYGAFYYVNSSCMVIRNQRYYVYTTNDLLPRDYYEFDEEGKMINPPIKPSSDPDEGKVVLSNSVSGQTEKAYNLYKGLYNIRIVLLDREQYYGKNNEQPLIDGYLFAGWFEDEECTKAFEGTSGKAYAKFVDETVLTVKAQASVGIKDMEEGKLRFISTVDSANYSNVGYYITYGNKTRHITLSKVYKKFYAVQKDGTKKYYEPQDFCELSKYFVAYTITGVPQSAHDNAFIITPFWTTLDGTYVEGEDFSKTISDMPNYDK